MGLISLPTLNPGVTAMPITMYKKTGYAHTKSDVLCNK